MSATVNLAIMPNVHKEKHRCLLIQNLDMIQIFMKKICASLLLIILIISAVDLRYPTLLQAVSFSQEHMNLLVTTKLLLTKRKRKKKDNQKNKPPQKHRQPCFNLIAATSGTLMQS